MTDKQYDLIGKAEDEYVDYIDKLLTEDKQTLISMNDKTAFFANMLNYIKEREISSSQLHTLIDSKEPLNDLYLCYMNNNEDYVAYTRTAIKVLYEYTKECKYQNQM